MTESDVIVASAVVVPEAAEDERAPSLPQKRRPSSASIEGTKRQRLENEGESRAKEEDPSDVARDTSVKRRASKDVDERKRGKRLFGALLGTLAQDSSSTAQKRRTDIERKQREKLKLQAEEDVEKKAERLNALLEGRRQEQKKYDEQTKLLKQSTVLATAHFLRTKTEPMLYYKPWDLRPEEKAQIDAQVRKVEDALQKETVISNEPNPLHLLQSESTHALQADRSENTEAVGNLTNEGHGDSGGEQASGTDIQSNQAPSSTNHEGPQDIAKDALDEGGDDMVEGGEDAVIY